MEPFADYANIFPGFPGRYVPVGQGNVELVNLVRSTYAALGSLKNRYVYRRGRNPKLKALDRLRLKILSLLAQVAKLRLSERHEQFQLLNLNESDISVSEQHPENPTYELIATKDLRLSLKVGLLQQVFGNPKVVIVIRDPGAQIGSITRLMRNKHLEELKRSLVSFPEHVIGSRRLQKYEPLVYQWDRLGQEERLVVWWIVNYDVLIEDCARSNVDYIVVKHEALAREPIVRYTQILDFAGVGCPESVRRYIARSSTAVGHEPAGAVDTRRDSAKHLRDSLRRVDPRLRHLIDARLSVCDIRDELREYAG